VQTNQAGRQVSGPALSKVVIVSITGGINDYQVFLHHRSAVACLGFNFFGRYFNYMRILRNIRSVLHSVEICCKYRISMYCSCMLFPCKQC